MTCCMYNTRHECTCVCGIHSFSTCVCVCVCVYTVSSGAHQYLDLVDVNMKVQIADDVEDKLEYRTVPGSRSELFSDARLSLREKHALYRFLKECAELKDDGDRDDENDGIDIENHAHGDEDMAPAASYEKNPAVLASYLASLGRLPSAMIEALCFETRDAALRALPSEEILRRVRRYVRSAGKFGNDHKPLLMVRWPKTPGESTPIRRTQGEYAAAAAALCVRL